MCFCGLFSYAKGVQMLSPPSPPHQEKTLSQWMSLSLIHKPIFLHPKLLFRGSQIEEDFLIPLPSPTPVPEQEKLQLNNKSPTKPTDKSSVLLVEELRVYSRR